MLISEDLLPQAVDNLLVSILESRICEQYEAGDGKSSTNFFGLKWSILLDLANETPLGPDKSLDRFSLIISRFFLSSCSSEENL